jgi:hypothetical protein
VNRVRKRWRGLTRPYTVEVPGTLLLGYSVNMGNPVE